MDVHHLQSRRSGLQRRNPQAAVDAWNRKFAIGDLVEYAEVRGDRATRYTVRSDAEVLSGHTAVVWLNGKSGCVAISHCTLVAKVAQ